MVFKTGEIKNWKNMLDNFHQGVKKEVFHSLFRNTTKEDGAFIMEVHCKISHTFV